MKIHVRILAFVFVSAIVSATAAADNLKLLQPLTSFGPNGDGTIKPGDGRTYLTTGNRQRGFAFNPVTGNVLLVDRANGPTGTSDPNVYGGIYVLNGITGAELASPMSFGSGLLNTNGIFGGDFSTMTVGVADDGAVYVANLVNNAALSATPLKIYRWSSDSTADAPTVAYEGDPGNGIGYRWGDTMDIRGAGPNTQIIVGTRTFGGLPGTRVAIFTTTDGTNFTANLLNTDAGENFGDGIAFGAGNTFWAKSLGQPLRHMSFNLGTGTAATLRAYDSSNFPGFSTLGPIAVDAANNLLAAQNVISTSDQVRLYDISDLNNLVYMDAKDFTLNNAPPAAPAGYIDFGGTNLYIHNVNNGLFALSPITNSSVQPPDLLTQPVSRRVAIGRTVSFSVEAIRATGYQWLFEGNPIANATLAGLTLTNAQPSQNGIYSVIASNAAGSITSSSATLTVVATNLHYLRYLWSIAPGSRSYMTLDSNAQGQTPLQRSIAYNALSNHVYIINRTAAATGPSVNVVDATTGADLYTLKVTGIPTTTADQNSITLLGIGVADDGAIYAGNMSAPGSTAIAAFRVYRWASADPTIDPVMVFRGEPAGQNSNFRWGDTFTVRGSGTNTQILIDDNGGNYASILRPVDATMTTFTNTDSWYFRDYGSGSIGRSLQFGAGNTIWQKRKGIRLEQSSFEYPAPFGANLANPVGSFYNFGSTIGPVGLDITRNIGAGINMTTLTTIPDTLDLFELSDLNNPLLLARYNFPVNHRPNANFIGQVVFGDGKVFAIDGNNGVLGFTLHEGTPPTPEIITQPQDKILNEGVSLALTVFTADSSTYQWQKNGVNIENATDASLAIVNANVSDAGTYRVLVSNEAGTTISSNAVVTVRSTNEVLSLETLWKLSPGGTNTFLTSTDANGQPDNLQRGMAYNPVTGHLLIVSRVNSPTLSGIYIVDSNTGALLGSLNTNGISNGGTFILNKIDVADDGVIYAMNYGSYPGTTNTIYRWENESAAPTIAFAGDPGVGSNQEWGRTFAIRGSGSATQILLGCRKTIASLFTTADGLTFTPNVLQTDAAADDFGFGIAFGQGNTFWGKSDSRALKQFSFDIVSGTATTIRTISDAEVLSVSPIGFDPVRNLIGGIAVLSGPDQLRVFDVTSPAPPAPILATEYFPIDKNNVNLAGAVEFAGDKVFALDTNNGLIAYKLNSPGTGTPTITVTRSGAIITLSWDGSGYTLEATSSLTSPNWAGVSYQSGSPNIATENTSSGNKFYRLRK